MASRRSIKGLHLGEYYISSVETLWRVIKTHPDTDDQSALVVEIESLMKRPEKTWSDVYALERLIVPLMPELEVTAYFQRRLARAKSLALPSLSAHETNWQAAQVEKHHAERLKAKQAAYSVLLDDLNWYNTAQRLDRRQRDLAAQRLWKVGLVGLVVVALPWLLLCGLAMFSASTPAAASVLKSVLNFAPVFGLYTALSFGLLGAVFSRINAFQTNVATLTYEDISHAFQLRYLLVRFGFGMVGASVLYFLMAGGFLQGSLFPDLVATGFFPHEVEVWGLTIKAILPNAEFAKLVVWSFIGGFSERFVSSALERAETNAVVAENKQEP